jgi:hypothetical protein
MTRSEPLTSLALVRIIKLRTRANVLDISLSTTLQPQANQTNQQQGRSPYDDVQMGEGEGDPRAPVQLYDEHGRPVNPDARRLNRELIRAHNEVMLAIGVAEPDDGAAERQEMQQREKARMESERIGWRLSGAAHLVEIASAWGLHGLRNRILVGCPKADPCFSAGSGRLTENSHAPGLQAVLPDPFRRHLSL